MRIHEICRSGMKSKVRYYICGIIFILFLIFFKCLHHNVDEIKSIEIKSTHTHVSVYTIQATEKYDLVPNITVLFRYVPERFDDLLTALELFTPLHEIPIIIASDTTLNATVRLNISRYFQVTIITLKIDLMIPHSILSIAHYLKTKYILIMPYIPLITTTQDLLNLTKVHKNSKSRITAIPIQDSHCLSLTRSLRFWTLEYKLNNNNSHCDSVSGEHVIFMSIEEIIYITEPFILPFPESLYLRTSGLGIKVKMLPNEFFKVTDPVLANENMMKSLEKQRIIMYHDFKIKKVIRETGMVEWYGCTRETPRCFGTIVDSVPDYLNLGRWTPPCCMRILRETVHHVFKILKKYNVTFWLEGGSLLGAMRMKDIIPWDYDVDVGIYARDISKCPWLRALEFIENQRGKPKAIYDPDGYLWEQARKDEGEFYRVQSSRINRIHVDIFPFYPIDGIMTKSTWLRSHPQDKEFPEHFLQPLSTLEFAGIEAPTPNNIRDFLELKFGRGCIENPKYPNPEMEFPKELKAFAFDGT